MVDIIVPNYNIYGFIGIKKIGVLVFVGNMEQNIQIQNIQFLLIVMIVFQKKMVQKKIIEENNIYFPFYYNSEDVSFNNLIILLTDNIE